MAITVNNTIDQYSPVYNPIGFSVTSTNYAQQNFNFIADIYINSSTTLTARLKFPVYPSSDDGYVDISGVLKNYLTSDAYTISESGISKCSNSILRYDIQWGEQYGPSSGVTTNVNLTSTSGYAFNGSLPHINLGNYGMIQDWVNWNSSNYTYLNNIIYLTNAPRTGINIKSTEGYALYFLNTGTNYAKTIRVVYYTSADALISTQTITNSFATVGLYDTRLLRVACGPLNLTVPATAAYYIVYPYDNGGNVTGEGFIFNIDTSCSNAARNYRFIFKNRMGAFDSYTFMGQYERTNEIKRDFYKSMGGTWVSNLYGISVTSRGDKQYNTVVTDSFKCQSGWITQAESEWLAELIESPEVYIYHPYINSNTPVNIIDANYTYKTTARDQLFNLELTFKPTYNSVRQQY